MRDRASSAGSSSFQEEVLDVLEPSTQQYAAALLSHNVSGFRDSRDPMENFVTISGCSGGGKSTLLAELGRRGFATVDEPGRRIVSEELERGGRALPWVDAVAFARRAIEMSLADRVAAEASAGWVFFDRGLIDAAAALEHLTGEPIVQKLARIYRFNKRVFLTPPWPEIYRLDQERRLGLAEGVAEYDRLTNVYPSVGYDIHLLPKVSVAERAEWLLASLAR